MLSPGQLVGRCNNGTAMSPPQRWTPQLLPSLKGYNTAAIAGFLISALGGSKVQFGGPTGALVVIVAGSLPCVRV